MNVRDDYLLRLIHQVRAVLAAALGRMKKKEPAAILQECGPLLERTVGLSLDAMDALSLEGLLGALSPGGELSTTRAALAGELLLVRAEALRDLAQPEASRRSAARAAALFDAVTDETAQQAPPDDDDERALLDEDHMEELRARAGTLLR